MQSLAILYDACRRGSTKTPSLKSAFNRFREALIAATNINTAVQSLLVKGMSAPQLGLFSDALLVAPLETADFMDWSSPSPILNESLRHAGTVWDYTVKNPADYPYLRTLLLLRMTEPDFSLQYNQNSSGIETAQRERINAIMAAHGALGTAWEISPYLFQQAQELPIYLGNYLADLHHTIQAIKDEPASIQNAVQMLLSLAWDNVHVPHGYVRAADSIFSLYADQMDSRHYRKRAFSWTNFAKTTGNNRGFGGDLCLISPTILAAALPHACKLLNALNTLWDNTVRDMHDCHSTIIPVTTQSIFECVWRQITQAEPYTPFSQDMLPQPLPTAMGAVHPRGFNSISDEVIQQRTPSGYADIIVQACQTADTSPRKAADFFDAIRQMDKAIIAGLRKFQSRLNEFHGINPHEIGSMVGALEMITTDEYSKRGHNSLALNLIEALRKRAETTPDISAHSDESEPWMRALTQEITHFFQGASYPSEEQRLVFALGCFLASEKLGQLEFRNFQPMQQLVPLSPQERLWVDIHVEIEDGHAEITFQTVEKCLKALGRDPLNDKDLWNGFNALANCIHRFYVYQGSSPSPIRHNPASIGQPLAFIR